MIIFLYGQDSFRSQQKLKELINKFLREVDPAGSSLKMIAGQNTSAEQIIEAAGPASLLAKKRLIVIKEIFTNKNSLVFEQLYQYFKKRKIKNDNIIIFIDSTVKTKKLKNKLEYLHIDASGREKSLAKQPLILFKFLLQQKYTQQFNLLGSTELTNWIKKEAQARDGKISHQAAQLLASLVGNDLWQVSNEIDKLINYKAGCQPKLTATDKTNIMIEEEEVAKLVRANFDENIFALTDALSSRNKALATKLLEEQIATGLTTSYLLTMIIRQFRILLRIRQSLDLGLSPRKIINLLKIHPFVAQKGINQVRNFNLISLKNIFNQLIQIDYSIKTGRAKGQTLLNLLVAKI